MNAVVEKEWLKQHLEDPKVRIADCRFYLGKSDEGKKQYLADHIPGAVYFHLEEDLSSPVLAHGGRHPLPDIARFNDALEKAGIGSDTIVVAYDQGDGAFAARLYWLLQYIGHKNVVVLNGGYASWESAGFPADRQIPAYPRTTLVVSINQDIMATYDEVKKIVSEGSGETVLIDSRDPKRFKGIEEPIDKKAGHIPYAVNKNWVEGLDKGSYKPVSEQEKRFSEFTKQQPLIVYCGSGVTAAPNYIALKESGYENVKLYVGSFSDWISYQDNEVQTEE